MSTALIGYTGLVGGNLVRQGAQFSVMFNSKNISEIRGRSFSRIICAGARGTKWIANKNPAEDRAQIEQLMSNLDTIDASQFTLISTVDVYPNPITVDETTPPQTGGLHAYGVNRLMLERFVTGRFPRHTIVRLPAIFGYGLKKNAMYDLMNNNQLELVHPGSSFQWYPLSRLSSDLIIAEGLSPGAVNFATEPVTMHEIRDKFFPGKEIGSAAKSVAHYDFRTQYAEMFDGSRGYILDRPQVMSAIGSFVGAAT